MEIGITKAGIEERKASKVVKKSGIRVGYNYIIIKSLKESQKNDVVKCLYIKALNNFGFCVIKEGSKGESLDKDNRDIRDRLLWQSTLHKKLQDKVELPKFIDSFEENGNFYLVIEYIKGNPLYNSIFKNQKIFKNTPKENRAKTISLLDYLVQVCKLLHVLHKENFVHRDVTPANFLVTNRRKVYMIDLELCYALDHTLTPPFQLGTFGYMSPQQRSINHPSIQDDIFSLGAILFQAFTGIHPIKLTDPINTSYSNSLSFFVDDDVISKLLIKMLNPIAEERPALDAVQETIENYRADFIKNNNRKRTPETVPFENSYVLDKITEGLRCLASPLLTDEKRGWFADDIQKEIKQKNHINKNWYASFNVGAAGVIYLLSKLKKVNIDVSIASAPMNLGLDLIEEKYIKRLEPINPSLYFGASGIAITINSAFESGLITDEKYRAWINTLLSGENKNIFLQHGISGQSIAKIKCGHYSSSKELLDQEIEMLLANQKENGSWIKIDGKGNRKATRGLSNGVAGILLYLLEYSKQNNNPKSIQAIHQGLNWLMKKSINKMDRLTWTSSSGKELEYGIQEGNAGIALVFMRAYQLLGDKRYGNYAQKALLSYNKKIIHDDLSNSSGLSGLGEVYLEAASIFQDYQYYERASHIAQVILHLRKENSKYGTYWNTGSEKNPTSCFANGNSGILHFLLRYCNPDNIEFPLI